MRAYTTSFFIVSRFLPARQARRGRGRLRRRPLPGRNGGHLPARPRDERCAGLTIGARTTRPVSTARRYSEALTTRRALRTSRASRASCANATSRMSTTAPSSDAMRLDVTPRPFKTLDDLIDSYVYGSAVVVGYFLAHVYGASDAHELRARAFVSARDLGIALQLTNFLRDVAEDQRRGRVYLPTDVLRAEGIEELDACDPRQQSALARVLRRLAAVAAEYYASAQAEPRRLRARLPSGDARLHQGLWPPERAHRAERAAASRTARACRSGEVRRASAEQSTGASRLRT